MNRMTACLGTAAMAALLTTSAFAAGAQTPTAPTATTPPVTAPTEQAAAPNAASPKSGAQNTSQMAALEVESQAVKDGTVTIDLAYMPQPGFVAVHELQDGKLSPDALGYAQLKPGETDNISVKLNGPVKPDTTPVAVLHQDTGKIGTFEFSAKAMDNDGPEMIAGRPVAVPFRVIAQADQAGAMVEPG